MENILNDENNTFRGKNRLLQDCDTCVHVDENGKMFIGIIFISKDTYSNENVIVRSNDGQQTNTEGPPIFKTVPVRMFPELKSKSFEVADIFRVADRLFSPGDFVKRNGRLGFVLNIRQTASARIVCSRSKYNPERALYVYNKPQDQFWNPNQQVAYKVGALFQTRGWIGEVTKYKRDVVLKVYRTQEEFSTRKTIPDAGTYCRAHRDELADLPDFKNASLNSYSRRKVCPGFTVKLTWGAFTGINPHWESQALTPTPRYDDIIHLEVLNIELTSVTMKWLKQIPGTSSLKPPNKIKKGRLNTLISCINKEEDLLLGDLKMCRMNKNDWDHVFTKAMWENTLAKSFHLHRRVCKRPYPRDNELTQPKTPKELAGNIPVEVMETKTEVDVEWLDGIVETIPALDLHPISNYKQKATPTASLACLRTERTDSKKYGVIQSVSVVVARGNEGDPDVTVTTMVVQWYRITDNLAAPPVPVGPPTEVILNDLESSPLMLHSGDVVMTNRERNDENFLFGEVIATFTDGRVRLRGPNGTIFRMWPNHLTLISPESRKSKRT